MALKYLNKKSDHPGSLKNREKVYLREQAEYEKIKK